MADRKDRATLQAYAAAAVALEDAKRAVADAERDLQAAGAEAVEKLDGSLPVTVALPGGHQVLIDDVAEEGNYHLEYTVSAGL